MIENGESDNHDKNEAGKKKKNQSQKDFQFQKELKKYDPPP